MLAAHRRFHRHGESGMSLVELMVGIAVGMFVVAAAAMLVSTQLSENRRLLIETQIQQDLRATADIVTRDLRRAGSYGNVMSNPIALVWTPTLASAMNPQLEILPDSGSEIVFRQSREQGRDAGYGFRLNGGAIQINQGSGPQDLTDRSTMEVLQFSVTPQYQAPIQLPCARLCADGTQDCWPTVTVRSFVVGITGRSTSDPKVVRSVRSVVRLRADAVLFNDPASPSMACPA